LDGRRLPCGGTASTRYRHRYTVLAATHQHRGACSWVAAKAVQGGQQTNVRRHKDERLTGHDLLNIRLGRIFVRSPGTFDQSQNLIGHIAYIYICKKTYQFTTVCKDDVMISFL